MKYLNILLLFIPATIVERFILHTDDSIVFVTSCLAIVPLAVVIGDATEQIAIYTSPKVGGFLNATMHFQVLSAYVPLYKVQAVCPINIPQLSPLPERISVWTVRCASIQSLLQVLQKQPCVPPGSFQSAEIRFPLSFHADLHSQRFCPIEWLSRWENPFFPGGACR